MIEGSWTADWKSYILNPIGYKLVSCILYDTVGAPDNKELYYAITEYSSKFQDDDAMIAKYKNYRYTKSKTHQYKITREGDCAYLEIK